MSDKVAEVAAFMNADPKSGWVRLLWDSHKDQMREFIEETKELRNYIFATDTSKTSNAHLPWKNTTTRPKITQIRDNLHSNYLQALFPNDKWVTWQGYTADAAKKQVAKTITSYIDNKSREGHLRNTVSQLLYDYIDYGNAYVTSCFEARYKNTETERVADFIGPKAVRISPYDIVFNPRAANFDETWKIVRSVKTIGELKKLSETEPDMAFFKEAVARREAMLHYISGITKDDFDKIEGFEIDGFGNLYEYYTSSYVEILEFYGDVHDEKTGELRTNRMITVVDRSLTVRDETIPTYSGRAAIRHVGWRKRPDNLWAQGPLANLVGMQYRIDHLENAKADAFDLAIQPPLKIIGEVEQFDWGPSAEIHIDENGDVQEVLKNLNAIITCDSQIKDLEDEMELFAGAPREAMGIRTPGEKTALEVQTLSNAAARIFQEKVTTFEVELLEPLLNDMLEVAHRHLDTSDVIRVLDDDIGVTEFVTITKQDITANGIIRPVGARHFAQQAQELQNLIGVYNSPLAQFITPHTSGKAMTKLVENVVDVRGYNLFRENVFIMEQQETQALMNQASEDLEVQQRMPTDSEVGIEDDEEDV